MASFPSPRRADSDATAFSRSLGYKPLYTGRILFAAFITLAQLEMREDFEMSREVYYSMHYYVVY